MDLGIEGGSIKKSPPGVRVSSLPPLQPFAFPVVVCLLAVAPLGLVYLGMALVA